MDVAGGAPLFLLVGARGAAGAFAERMRPRLAADGLDLRIAASAEDVTSSMRSDDVVGVGVCPDEPAGLETIRDLRRLGAEPLVAVLPEGASEEARVLAWELGADDVLVEPISAQEFSARLRALLRRVGRGGGVERYYAGPLVVDVVAREARLHGRFLDLTAQEFSLLAFLVSRQRRVFTRRELLRYAWIGNRHGQDRATVTEHVRRLRRKFDAAGAVGDRWIVTVHGVGYRFDPQPNGAEVTR